MFSAVYHQRCNVSSLGCWWCCGTKKCWASDKLQTSLVKTSVWEDWMWKLLDYWWRYVSADLLLCLQSNFYTGMKSQRKICAAIKSHVKTFVNSNVSLNTGCTSRVKLEKLHSTVQTQAHTTIQAHVESSLRSSTAQHTDSSTQHTAVYNNSLSKAAYCGPYCHHLYFCSLWT